MVRIGHASIDERGCSRGGALGDNNGREVKISNWYNKPWHTLLRANDDKVAERMAACCEHLCRTNHVGYDQDNRNSLRNEMVKVRWNAMAMTMPCETDCSAFMSVCAEYAGVAMYAQYTNGNAPTTSNMVDKFYRTGMFSIYTYKSYLSSDKYLRRGDILVGKGHTVMILDQGSSTLDKPILCKGSKGTWVKVLQGKLNLKGYKLSLDGDYGPATEQAVISYQGEQGGRLVKDGIVGPATWDKLM